MIRKRKPILGSYAEILERDNKTLRERNKSLQEASKFLIGLFDSEYHIAEIDDVRSDETYLRVAIKVSPESLPEPPDAVLRLLIDKARLALRSEATDPCER